MERAGSSRDRRDNNGAALDIITPVVSGLIAVGSIAAARWAMQLSTPRGDWLSLSRLWVRVRTLSGRVASRVRVAWYTLSGYTHVRWIFLRRKWRTQAENG